ncbi:glycosyltransferase family 2 protein [Saccharopolyspora montiporae]|uniref:glycosyltransferase family 2 protein n=1 Tax=Saccharopolyspora montiporae TaxID=2781240 RepID=UPI00351BFF71
MLQPFPDTVDAAALAEFARCHAPDRFAPVVVLIAAYDEQDAIGGVLAAIPDRCCGLPVEVLVVVDGATDATARVAREHGARTCEVPVNRGQGAALRLGYHLAEQRGAQYVVTTDADGQYDPAELDLLLRPLLDDRADFTTGSRTLGSSERPALLRRIGTRVFATAVSALTGRRVTDTSFGFRAMRAQVPVSVALRQQQYQSAELLVGVLSRGYRVHEVPMRMLARTAGSSKKGNDLVYGYRYAKVVLGTWWRERRSGPPEVSKGVVGDRG